jgi:hypothetical protein
MSNFMFELTTFTAISSKFTAAKKWQLCVFVAA